MTWIALALAATSLVALLLIRMLLVRLGRLRSELVRSRSHRQSQATRHGQTLEQFAPLLSEWPWDPKEFRFLGSPVDGVQFHDDGIVFVEIKTGRSTLNARQRKIRDQVEAGRISWAEVRL